MSTEKFLSKSTCSPFLLGCKFGGIVLIPSFLQNILQHALLLWRRVGCMRPPRAPRTETVFSILFSTGCVPCVSRGLTVAMDKSGKCKKYFKKSYGGPNVGKSFPMEIRREIYVSKLPSLPGSYDIRIFIRYYLIQGKSCRSRGVLLILLDLDFDSLLLDFRLFIG